MMHHTRNYSLDYEPESRAVASLLDCSNTLKTKHSSKMLKNEQEAITPWVHLNRRPLEQTKSIYTIVKTNRTFAKTYHRYKSKLKTPKGRQSCNKTQLSTPKTKLMLDQIENYNYLSSNVINLTRELQLIHHKKKSTYVSNYIRQQLYLRLKSN